MQQLDQKTYVPPTSFAWIYFAMEEMASFFDWLEKAVQEADGMFINIPAWIIFDPLRSHPRCHTLLRKMNLIDTPMAH